MKKIILALAIVLTAQVVSAAPFLAATRDATTNPPTVYVLTSGQTWLPASVPALTTGLYGFKIDMVAAPTGASTIKIKPCTTDDIWGQLCGVETSFPLVRPVPPAAITGALLTP
jgi:hypothetical protein